MKIFHEEEKQLKRVSEKEEEKITSDSTFIVEASVTYSKKL